LFSLRGTSFDSFACMKTRILFVAAAIFSSLPQYAVNTEIAPRKGDELNSFARVANNAFTYGEKLEYRMHYGPFNAGYATLEVKPEAVVVNGRKTMVVRCAARSSKTIDYLYNKVRNDYESYIDEEAIIPLKYLKSVEEGKYRDQDYAVFDHAQRKINAKKGSVSDVPYKVQDLVSVYYWSRLWDVTNAKFGDTYPTEFYMDGKVYNYNIRFMGREVVKVDAGKFNAIKIRPQVKTGDLFKSDDALTIWVSDDPNHVVLKVESEIFIGSVALSLISYKGLKNDISSKIK